jgi:hypothetical protein
MYLALDLALNYKPNRTALYLFIPLLFPYFVESFFSMNSMKFLSKVTLSLVHLLATKLS